MVAACHQFHGRQAPVHHQHGTGLVAGKRNGFVQQGLVFHDLAAARARIGTHDHGGRRILNARGQRHGRKATKHHRVDGTNAGAGQHGKSGLGHHGHVDQHAVALLDAQRQQAGGHALHLCMQLGKGVDALGVGFGRDGNQRRLVGPVFQVPVYGVVAQVGGATGKPARKRRVAVVADLLRRGVPVDQRRLLLPECIAVLNRAAVKLRVSGVFLCHGVSPSGLSN